MYATIISRRVFYTELDKVIENRIAQKFLEKYGTFIKEYGISPKHEKGKRLVDNGENYSIFEEMRWDVSDELTVLVTLDEIYERVTDIKVEHTNIFDYVNPKIIKQVLDSKAKANKLKDIEL